MSAVETDIRAALESNVANISGAPSAGNRAWENVRFEPTPGTAWVRTTVAFTRTRPQDRFNTGLKRYDGTLLIDIFTPEGAGPKEGDELAEATRDAFSAGTVLSAGGVNVQIEWAERQRAALQDGPWYMIPVAIKWKAFN